MSYIADHKIFYKYCSTNVATLILKNNKIRMSSAKHFNDPYDCYAPSLVPEKVRNLCDELEKYIPQDDHINLVNMVKYIDDQYNAGGKAVPLQESLYQTAILCLSTCPNNQLMWSHYADMHKGVVLGFKPSIEDDSILRLTEPVKYSDKPPINKHIGGNSIKDIILTKPECWIYENEWRLCLLNQCNEDGYYDLPIRNAEIVEVHFGCKFSQCQQDEITALFDILSTNKSIEHADYYKRYQDRISYNILKKAIDKSMLFEEYRINQINADSCNEV